MSRLEPLPPGRERAADRKIRAVSTLEALALTYPDAACALIFDTPWQLLVATVLSAQCTDERVNLVTPELFRRFPTPERLAGAAQEDVESIIHSTGFFRQKARNIIAAARMVSDEYGGEVPTSMEALTRLPGVARKTANVVLSNCFPESAAGIAVDTHVQRIARRLGFTRQYDPVAVERDLTRLVERRYWNDVTHLLIDHGRAVCTARAPACDICPIADLCPSAGREFTPVGTTMSGRRRAR